MIQQCEHQRTEVRVKQYPDAGPRRLRQCLDCGQRRPGSIGPEVPHVLQCRPWDDALESAGQAKLAADREAYWETYRAKRAKGNSEAELEWRANYDRVIASPEWAKRRRVVLRRDGNICQACLEERATEVHHKTYAHLGNEPLFDLVAVCRPCHESITEMDRARRGRR